MESLTAGQLSPPSNAHEVGRWIEHNASRVDPAWGIDSAIKQLQLPPPSEALQTRKAKFLTFMNTFFDTCEPGAEHRRIFNATSTWEQVRQEAEAVREKYTSQRRTLGQRNRVFTKYACRIEFLTELIPNGDYTAPICGGLRMICSAARRHRELVDVVLNSLEALSEEINETTTYVRIYANFPNVLPSAEALYIAVLEAVEAVTLWLGKLTKRGHALLAGLKSIAQQDDYGAALQSKITTNVHEKSKAFDSAVQACFHQKVDGVARNVVLAGRTLDRIGGRIDEYCRRQFAANESLETQLRDFQRDLKVWVVQQLSTSRPVPPSLHLHQTTILLSHPPIPTPSALLSALGFSPASILPALQHDPDLVLFLGRSLPPAQQSLASHIPSTPAFRTWLLAPSSRVLLLHGTPLDLGSTQTSPVSPLSYLCALLARTVISPVAHALPTLFFCRLHADLDGPTPGPRGLLRSLIAQVLVGLGDSLDLGFLSEADLAHLRADDADLRVLWALYETVLARAGAGVVFCLLDGVNFFQGEVHAAEMHLVMHWMNSLARETEARGAGLVFKLLVTSPVGSEYFRVWFPGALEVALPGHFLADGQGFDELRMLMSTQGMLSAASPAFLR